MADAIRRPLTGLTPSRARELFLEAMATGLSITGSAKAAGISRETAKNWYKADPEFARRWDEAIEAGTDELEDAAIIRAKDGVREPVISQGRLVRDENGEVLTVPKFSDPLTQFLLRGRRGEKYRAGDKRRCSLRVLPPAFVRGPGTPQKLST